VIEIGDKKRFINRTKLKSRWKRYSSPGHDRNVKGTNDVSCLTIDEMGDRLPVTGDVSIVIDEIVVHNRLVGRKGKHALVPVMFSAKQGDVEALGGRSLTSECVRPYMRPPCCRA